MPSIRFNLIRPLTYMSERPRQDIFELLGVLGILQDGQIIEGSRIDINASDIL